MTVCLLIIDPQVDFHEGGSLAVNGATADSERIAKFIRDNLVKIDEIVVTLDSHLPHHIAHAKGWKDSSGQPPAVFSQITAQQIKDGIWIPANLDLEYCLRYTESLEKKGKFLLTIWPEHCIIGTNGHNVFPPLQEALEEWTSTSTRAWSSVMKGQNIRTEMYSALEAEIPDETDSNTYFNVSLLEKLRSFDQILICGQALSHCVNHTTRDLLRHFTTEEKGKIIVFRDGCSSVYGCDAQAEEFLSFVQSEGGRVMKIAEVSI